jgi:NAD(P)H-hydrate epimerase
MSNTNPIFLTRDQTRAADQFAIRQLGIPGIVLMENAGRGCAEILLHQFQSESSAPTTTAGAPKVLICCGTGNNGGDGLVIARHLQIAGYPTQILLMGEPAAYSGDALVNLKILQNLGLSFTVWKVKSNFNRLHGLLGDWTHQDWVVDALLGTGFQGDLRESYATVVTAINQTAARCLAVDIPTGLCCDSGTAAGACVRADLTATFIALKTGFQNPAAQMYLGQVQVVSIGVRADQIGLHP